MVDLRSRPGLIGLGVGLAAAGVSTGAGIVADRLWSARRRAAQLDATDAALPPLPEGTQTTTTVARPDDGVLLHAEVHRPAEPRDGAPAVVLCHGFALDSRAWGYQVAGLLEAGHTVVTWDQRGHGQSAAGDVGSYEVSTLSGDLLAVLQATVPEGPVALVGHSMGGMTVMQFALDYADVVRERVVAVCLVSTACSGLDDIDLGMGRVGRLISQATVTSTRHLVGRQGLVDAAHKHAVELESLIVQRTAFASTVPLSVVRLVGDMIMGTDMEVMSAFMPRLAELDLGDAPQHLDGIEMLIVHGGKDLLLRPQLGEHLASRLPGAHYLQITRAGHVLPLEHPEILTGRILWLLARARQGVTS